MSFLHPLDLLPQHPRLRTPGSPLRAPAVDPVVDPLLPELPPAPPVEAPVEAPVDPEVPPAPAEPGAGVPEVPESEAPG